jgi:L-alanine-DL-glutamate epimerase-like enolase superfamily enzyme
MRAFVDLGFTHAKMKIGADDLQQDLRRIETAASPFGGSDRLAVDAIYRYDLAGGIAATSALAPFGLWWFEDICDPLDFATLAHVATLYEPPIAVGEALFSLAEAKLLDAHGGPRRERDILEFDPVHCYGLPEYLKIVDHLLCKGWLRHAFWPHAGHLFSLHVVAALGLGGAEVNPLAFQPFCGLSDSTQIMAGSVDLPDAPGIGFELNRAVWQCFHTLSPAHDESIASGEHTSGSATARILNARGEPNYIPALLRPQARLSKRLEQRSALCEHEKADHTDTLGHRAARRCRQATELRSDFDQQP